MNGWRLFFALVKKDLVIEFRGRQFLWSSLSLGMLVVFMVGMALDASSDPPVDWAAGLLWACLFFASSITFNRHDAKDREFGGHTGVLLAPIDPSALFYTKWVSTCLFLFVVDCVVSGTFFVILGVHAPHRVLLFFLFTLVGMVCLTGVGTLVGALTAHSNMRDVLTPVLLFPLCVPLFLALVRLTIYTLQPIDSMPWIWLEVLLGYLAAFMVLPWLLFEPLLEV